MKKSYYDSIAAGYDELHRAEQLKKLQIIKEQLRVSENDLMLDVGCGTGLSADIFGCEIIGIDPSKQLLKKCSFKTFCAGAEKIPFPNNHFDIVISVTAIQNFEDYQVGLLEMKRVGKERFAFSVLKKSAKINEIKRFIQTNFRVRDIIEEEKDLIFIIN